MAKGWGCVLEGSGAWLSVEAYRQPIQSARIREERPQTLALIASPHQVRYTTRTTFFLFFGISAGSFEGECRSGNGTRLYVFEFIPFRLAYHFCLRQGDWSWIRSLPALPR